jgi:hypothetical protein
MVMPKLPERKVGVVACAGEELAEGTVTRLAALKVLHELRRGRTVTICLPLFLAGGEGDRAFAKFHPTITVDGCDLRCAARGTEMYSGKPAASVVVSELVAEAGLPAPHGRRRLNDAGRQAVDLTANRVAQIVDGLIDAHGTTADASPELPGAPKDQGGVRMCSCGSAIPVTKVEIHGRTLELLALPLIFQQFREAKHRWPDAGSEDALMDAVQIYNGVPAPAEKTHYREAIVREYEAFCARQEVQ